MNDVDQAPSEPDGERLIELLNALLTAESPHAKRRLLESEADLLLHPAAEAALREAIAEAAARGEYDTAAFFRAHADLLADCRGRGVTAVFDGLREEVPDSQVPAEVAEALRQLEALIERAATGADRALFEQQVALCERILAVLSHQHHPAIWAAVQGALGTALQRQGELTGDAAALQAAVAAHRAALGERTRERAPMDWAATQTNLGTALAILGKLTGDAAALQAAVAAYRAALEERTRARMPTDWATTQNNLGIALQSQGELTGDAAALRAAVEAYRAALREQTRARVPMDWAVTQNNLGNALQRQGELTGDAAALQAAVEAYRAALQERTRERTPVAWAMTQTNLGNALQRQGELTGDAAALQAAVAAHRAALKEQTRERAPMAWARTQNNLGTALAILGKLTGDAAALRAAVAAFRAGLGERTRERAPMDWAMTQTNLGNALRSQGELTGDAAALQAAVAAFRAALQEHTRARAPMDWATTQTNLGSALAIFGELTGDAAALQAAEAAFRAALQERTRERAPMAWARTQTALGNALQSQGELTDDAAATQAAVAAYRAALEAYDSGGAEDNRQGTASHLAALLARLGRFDQAAAVIGPTLAHSDLALMDAARSPDARARAVEQVGDLHGLLSLCRLRQAQPDVEGALLAAEAGRARLLADALALDAVRPADIDDPDVLAQIEAARARRQVLRVQLGYERLGPDAGGPDAGRSALSADERERLQDEMRAAGDAYVALCRRHGLLQSPAPLSLAAIRAAVPAGGALVLPVLPEHTAFAFVVTAASSAAVVDLPRLDRREVVRHLSDDDRWLGAYYTHFRTHGGQDAGAAARWRGQLTATLAWLWERLLEPVHVHLRDAAGLAPGAPVVLLPPGLLGLLPLQAAGPGPDGRTFGDHWTVSFAPSLRTLITCQGRALQRRGAAAGLLAVLDPDGSLPGARAEEAMLGERFARAGREPVVLLGQQARLAAVLQHLPAAACFHASTHGWHDPLQPARSGLVMADGPLRLEMLRHVRLDAARLVFLSACESGLSGVRSLPDEFIGLPAGFVQAGAACVVGSLWPIRDDAAFLLAGRFYDLWLDRDGAERTAPVLALRDALGWLRALTFADLRRMFTAQAGPDGPELVIHAGARHAGARFEPMEPPPLLPQDHPSRPAAIRLPLGPDDARPYHHPEHWAAFACTGV